MVAQVGEITDEGLALYRIEDQEIELSLDPDVWAPYSATYLLHVLSSDHSDILKASKELLDMGSGTGILGIAIHKLSNGKVVMVDNNAAARRNSASNARLNKMEKDKDFEVVNSDTFSNLEGRKFDLIVGNLPMNPTLEGVVIQDKAARSNQTPDQYGRSVVESFVRNVSAHLNEGGHVFFSTSSRQIYPVTEILLNRYFPNSWEIVNRSDPSFRFLEGAHHRVDIKDPYYQPFLQHWHRVAHQFYVPTIYQIGKDGIPYQIIELPEKKIKLTYEPVTHQLIAYILNGDNNIKGYRVIEGADMPVYDPNLPVEEVSMESNPDDEYYHNYSIIHLTQPTTES